MDAEDTRIAFGLLAGLLAILFLNTQITKGFAGRIELVYPRTAFHIAKISDKTFYFVGPISCLLVLVTGWYFAPLGFYFAWVGLFVCMANLIVKSIKAGRDYDEISFDNLALDILIALPIGLAFFFGTVIFLFAIALQSI